MISKADQLKKNSQKPLKPKKCKECRQYFTRTREDEECCSPECAIAYVPKKFAIKKRKGLKQFRETDKATLTRDAQTAFNKYIRKRDELLPCISCGHTGRRQRHAGHYRPVGRNSQLRFNEDNCHSQCSICNNHLSGNLVQYREALMVKIGNDRVLDLEESNEPKSYTLDDLRAITKLAKEKYKKLV